MTIGFGSWSNLVCSSPWLPAATEQMFDGDEDSSGVVAAHCRASLRRRRGRTGELSTVHPRHFGTDALMHRAA